MVWGGVVPQSGAMSGAQGDGGNDGSAAPAPAHSRTIADVQAEIQETVYSGYKVGHVVPCGAAHAAVWPSATGCCKGSAVMHAAATIRPRANLPPNQPAN